MAQLIGAAHLLFSLSMEPLAPIVELAAVSGLAFGLIAVWGFLTADSGFDQPIETRIDGWLAGLAAANFASVFLVLPTLGRMNLTETGQAALLIVQSMMILFIVGAACGLVWQPSPDSRLSFACLIGGAAIQAFTYNWGASNAVHQFDGGPERILVAFGVDGLIALACLFATRARKRRGGVALSEPNAITRALGVPGICVLIQLVIVIRIAIEPTTHWTPLVFIVPSFVLIAYRLSVTASLAQRLTERTRERDRMTALVNLSRVLIESNGEASLCRELATACARTVHCSNARVALFEPGGRAVHWQMNQSGGWPAPSFAFAHAVARRLAGASEPAAWSAAGLSLPALIASRWNDEGIERALVAPLRSAEGVIGFVELWHAEGEWFSFGEDVAVVAAMCRETSLAIQHGRALESARRSAEDRALILRVSQAAASVLGLNTVADEIVRSSLGVAGAESCAIEHWLPDEGCFEVLADCSIQAWPGPDMTGTKHPGNLHAVYAYAFVNTDPLLVRRGDPQLNDSVLIELMDEWGVGSAVTFPLWADGQLIGLLEFFARDENAFDAAAIRLGEQIAVQAGLAIRHAHNLAEAKRNAEERALLLRVSQAATSNSTMTDMLAEIASVSIELPMVESCSVRLWRKQEHMLERVAAAAVPDWDILTKVAHRLDTRDLPMSKSLWQREPVLRDLADPNLPDEPRAMLTANGIGSLLLLPLWVGDECVGELIFGSRETAVFTEGLQRLGKEIAQSTAVAIQQARAHDDVRQLADEQAAMLKVSQTIGQSLEQSEVFEEITNAGMTLPGVESSQLEIWRPETRQLEIAATSCIPEWWEGSPRGTLIDADLWPTTLKVIESHQPLAFDEGSMFMTAHERKVLFEIGKTGSGLIVPIVSGGQCSGALTFYSRAVNAFNERHERLGLNLANQAALAIERARVHEALEEQAVTDGLTGLLNHRAVQDRLTNEIARANRDGKPVAVLMIDVDFFKQINDAHGHLAGDQVLQEVAKCLRHAVRATDHIGRYGGDEFMIVLPGAEASDAVVAAERIIERVSAVRLVFDHDDVEIQLSVGYATHPMDGDDPASLIAAADHSMYAAKHYRNSTPRDILTKIPVLARRDANRARKKIDANAQALGRRVPL